MKCKKCKNKITSFSFMDDDRKITATCICGYSVSWKAKPRKKITLELLCQKPVMAIYEYGQQREPTPEEYEEKKLEIIKMAINLKLI